MDDDENNLDMLSRRLRRAGYDVEVASSAKEALSAMERTEMELVLLDNMMPEMSGIDLLRLLRATQSPSQLPVIMVTAMAESKDIVKALDLGANDYITKPVNMAVALARIETQLRRKKAEEDLQDSQERLALAMRGTNDGMWDWDLRSGEVFYSTRWKAMLGYGEDEIAITPEEWLNRVHHDDIAELRQLLAGSRDQPASGDLTSEHRLRHKNGSYHWMLCRAYVQRSPDGSPLRMVGSITDVNQTKARDPLTGLPNRLAFHEYLQDVLDEHRAGTGRIFAVFFIDLDRFKLVNDSLGHSVGDLLLMEIAKRLEFAVQTGKRAKSLRPLDALARFGGDEFTLVIENVEDVEDARGIASRLLEEISCAAQVVGKELLISASIGIAMGSAEYMSAHELIRDADTAMYRAKSLGKARCEVFDAEMREDSIFRLEMENDLQRALSQRELEVYYQPKVDVRKHRIDGFEALLRWHHPTRGFVSPSQFIPTTEET
ncbi:MAG: diguanylate cyclase, partial [Chloroflexi bacterium]|nr:diguanylate cyclase [Chloroflexota bacterium]